MTFMIRIVIFVALILSVACGYVAADGSRQRNNSVASGLDRNNRGSGCDSEREIHGSLRELASGESVDIERARNSLLSYAQRSAECKNEVIRSLMNRMNTQDLNFEKQSSNYFLWREGSQLLGELKALESIDLLISHLDLTDGYHSSSMAHQPAILGLRQMGPAAIPKLTIALRQGPNRNTRMAAAYCLTSIGGPSAMKALKDAKASESDKCVARFIDVSLNTFSYKRSGQFLFDNAAPQADINARRNWLIAFECIE